MNPATCLRVAISALALALVENFGWAASPAPARPSILFIIANDLGYRDRSYYDATNVVTPRSDSLAREGVRLLEWSEPLAEALKSSAP